jgi:hypothetical protein
MDLPPKSTVHNHFSSWRSSRTLLRLRQVRNVQVREAARGAAEPTVTILDSKKAEAA